ncbi:NACHT, LRR and PYD domains-containing protein 1 [Hondaea fermentalgiana]|uniref:non-specific serine/threonine protein kinase n=1 Tax=Hondaea fermentalgiana TaxID=2315210 RepID=A0A2R5GAB1_9STRA|nr:NACHT, LRR and PYD domains-containing protein 1 [Hondaea fermentalgiana]|eukprot:GBG27966.1 NACHT, LRR and PYD domains-containing protein 1 [Hondaea fermentalgiana]
MAESFPRSWEQSRFNYLAYSIADAIRAMSDGETWLSLQRNKFGDDGVTALANALKENTSLQKLALSRNLIGDHGATALANALKENTSLQDLALQWNEVGDDGATALANALKENTSLQKLNLSKNGIGDSGAEAVACALAEHKSLQNLNLQKNGISTDGAKEIAEAFVKSQVLEMLKLGWNAIGDDGAVHVAKALEENKSLLFLEFRGNDITGDGAKQLANALAESESLKALDISNNNIGDDGASALAGALAQIKSLVTLHLQDNAIGDDGANEIAKALAANNSLQSLKLSENLIGPHGAEAMAGALVKNSTLEELEYVIARMQEWIGNEGAEALAVALESNNILQELALGHYPYASPDIFDRIGSRLKLVKDELNELSETAAQALKTDQKVRWGRAKLMVVGKAAAGKTSTIRTLLDQPFVPEHVSTIGIDLMLMHTRDWKERKNIGDADLGEQLAKHKYRNKRKHEELDQSEAQSSKDAARSVPKAPRAAPPADSANSASAVPSPPPQSPSVQFDKEVIAKAVNTPLRIRVKEQAGKEEKEISFTIWDYGGQEVFYALHHLFLTQYGVYVVVFDMREVLGKERFKEKLDEEGLAKLASQDDAIQTLRFWLDSIRLHAPGVEVALIGTFLDQVPELDQHHEIQETLEERIFDEMDGDPKIHRNIWKEEFLQFFPINNQDREDVDGHVARLKDQLTRSVADKAFVKEKVPLRWSYCLDQLLQQSDPYMQFDDVEALAVTKCFVAKKDVRKMLEYLHELGVLLYFSKNEALCKVVVIQPQWLLKNLSRVICDPSAKHMRRHMNKLRSGAGERTALPPHLDAALRRWKSHAVASRAFLEFLWEGNPVDFLVSLMETTLLACPSPWVSDDAGKKDTILVPSLLRAASEHDKEDGRRWVGDSALAYVDFEFLPKGFFQRLVALLFQEFQGVATVSEKLFADVARADFGGMKCLMEVSQRRTIFRFGSARRDRPLASLLALLSKELKEIDETFMRGKLGPKLFVSSDGTESDESCALAESLADPLAGNTIRTRSS